MHHCTQHVGAVTWDYGENMDSTLKQRSTALQFFAVNFLIPEQYPELIDDPVPDTVPFLLALTMQSYGQLGNVTTENTIFREGKLQTPWRTNSAEGEN